MKRALRIAAPLAAIFVAAPAAYAQNAIMRDDATLRAGPGFNYPRVAYVPEDARVTIHGCLRGYSWCDISWRGDRGWIDASNLSYAWNNRYVVVEEWGPRIGLPVIAFSVEDYWTRYYRHRPWWNQRYTWFERDHNWRGGERWRDRDNDRWDRDNRRGDWRDRQQGERGDRNEWRNRQQGDNGDWRNRQRTDRDTARDRDGDTRQRSQQGQNGGWSQREGRGEQNRQFQQDSGRNRGGDNMSTGRIPQRQHNGGERGERM